MTILVGMATMVGKSLNDPLIDEEEVLAVIGYYCYFSNKFYSL